MNIPVRNRELASLVIIGIVVGAAFSMAQQKPLVLSDVVAKLQNRLSQSRGLSFEVELRSAKGNRISFRIQAMRPNYFKVEGENQSFYCDGVSSWQYFPLRAQYLPFVKDEKGMSIPLANGFDMYSPASRFKADYSGVEEAVFEGKPVIALIIEPQEIANARNRIFIDPETWLPVGFEQKMLDDIDIIFYRNVKTDRLFTPADFAWTPPKGVVDGRTVKVQGTELLKVGDPAPDFDLPLANGRRLSLGEALKGKKGLLLNFWFINCGYCLYEMPQLAALYEKVKDLEIVAVNDTDETDAIRKFLEKPKYPFPVAIDEGARTSDAYKLKNWGRPISYLILPNRTIAYVQVGYDVEKKLAKLEEELARLGIIHD